MQYLLLDTILYSNLLKRNEYNRIILKAKPKDLAKDERMNMLQVWQTSEDLLKLGTERLIEELCFSDSSASKVFCLGIALSVDLALVLAQILIPSVSEAWAWIQVGQGGGGHENIAASYTGQIATRKKNLLKNFSYEVDEIIVNQGLCTFNLFCRWSILAPGAQSVWPERNFSLWCYRY